MRATPWQKVDLTDEERHVIAFIFHIVRSPVRCRRATLCQACACCCRSRTPSALAASRSSVAPADAVFHYVVVLAPPQIDHDHNLALDRREFRSCVACGHYEPAVLLRMGHHAH